MKHVIKIDPILGTKKLLKYEYDGTYKNDKKEGHGVFKWPSDGIYEGAFKEDFRHGFGIMRWADGTIYEGEWECGVQCGRGKLMIPDGTLKIGIFKDNILIDE